MGYAGPAQRAVTAPSATSEALLEIYQRLEGACHVDGWHWRADSEWFEVCAGAILVQHTAWSNVERALARLSAAGVFSLEAVTSLPEEELAELVRPAGMPLQKARRLKAFAALVERHGGAEGLFALPTEQLRAALLGTYGVGRETADAILLHAARRPVFVVDAYTVRLFRRLGPGPEGSRYDAWQRWFEERLPVDRELYRRYHAAIVLHCKETCRARPRCVGCCLLDVCANGRKVVEQSAS
jgi:endonuclease-3 related protein